MYYKCPCTYGTFTLKNSIFTREINLEKLATNVLLIKNLKRLEHKKQSLDFLKRQVTTKQLEYQNIFKLARAKQELLMITKTRKMPADGSLARLSL